MEILSRRKYRKLTADTLSDMCRQIGVMTGAGITMAKAMEVLKNTSEKKRTAWIYGELEDRIKRGYSIGDSMESLGVFPEMAVNMFRAAEVSGQLDKTANDLAEHYRKEHRTMTQMKAAAMYPKILFFMAINIVLFAFLVIMPMVEPLFYGVELPRVTRILMKISGFLQHDWYIVAAALVVVILLEPMILSNHVVKYVIDKMIFYIPVLGKQIRIIYTARFARNLSRLYASGIPMMVGLEITSRTIGNRYLETQILDVVHEVENGVSLSRAIEFVHGLDKKLPAVIFVGEETGKLDMMLLGLAEGYEYEAEIAINKLVSMIEPLMIVVIGILVAVILLGIMIPMWSLYEYIG